MSLDYEFMGIRLLGGSFMPVKWNITADIAAPDKKSRPREENEYNATLTYQKLFFWLETNLPNIIIVDATSEEDMKLANYASNIVMYCPGDAYDDVIVRLIHSKLSALAEDNLVIGKMQIQSSDMSVKYTFECLDGDYELPSTASHYFEFGETRHSEPWWERADGFCFEFVIPKDIGITPEEFFKDVIDPIDEFDKIIAESDTSTKAPADIVKVERWKPKKI